MTAAVTIAGFRLEDLRRQVSGEYRVPLEELLGWAIACKDISLLPQPDSIVDLYPPGSLPT